MDHIDFSTSSTFTHSTLSLSLYFIFLPLSYSAFLVFFRFFFLVSIIVLLTSLSLSTKSDLIPSSLLFLFNIHLFLSLIPSLSLSVSLFFSTFSHLQFWSSHQMKVWFSLLESLFVTYSLYNSLFGFHSLKGRMLSKRNLRHFGLWVHLIPGNIVVWMGPCVSGVSFWDWFKGRISIFSSLFKNRVFWVPKAQVQILYISQVLVFLQTTDH